MSDLIVTERSNLIGVANAVRNRTGKTNNLTIGEIINEIGAIVSDSEEKTVELDFSNGDVTVTPSDGKLLSEVNISKPETLIPENIAKDIEVAGIVGTHEGGGGSGGDCDCPEYVEGEGIDIIENELGQRVVSIEDGSISDEKIESISMDKIVQKEGMTLILNGGSIDG